jgi:hypothetical protein
VIENLTWMRGKQKLNKNVQMNLECYWNISTVKFGFMCNSFIFILKSFQICIVPFDPFIYDY